MIDHDLGQALSQADEKQLRTAARAAIKGYEPDQLERSAISHRASRNVQADEPGVAQASADPSTSLRRLHGASEPGRAPFAAPHPRAGGRRCEARGDRRAGRAAGKQRAEHRAVRPPHLPCPRSRSTRTPNRSCQVSWQRTPSPRAVAADPVDSVTRQSVADLAAGLVDAISNRRFNQALQRVSIWISSAAYLIARSRPLGFAIHLGPPGFRSQHRSVHRAHRSTHHVHEHERTPIRRRGSGLPYAQHLEQSETERSPDQKRENKENHRTTR